MYIVLLFPNNIASGVGVTWTLMWQIHPLFYLRAFAKAILSRFCEHQKTTLKNRATVS